MGGMGFGKRSQDYYTQGLDGDYDYSTEDDSTLHYLQRLEQYANMLGREEDLEEPGDPEAKRGLGSVRSYYSGKRGMGSAMAAMRNHGKRGALSSLRSQGFTKYNI